MAATVVALAHFRPPLPYQAELFLLWQNAAVDLFFVLSGFTLSYVYSRESFRLSSYLIARIARIYPLYLVTLIVAWAAYVWPLMIDPATYPVATAVSDFLRQVLMVNAWPIVGSGVHWNLPAWSISVEWFCYLLLFPALLRLRAPRLSWAKLVCIAALSFVSYRLFMAYFDERIVRTEVYTAPSQWSYWLNLLRGVLGFTAGWIVHASFKAKDWLRGLCTRFATLIWLCFAALLVLWYCGLLYSQALVFVFPFVVLAATDPTSASSRILASRPLHFLGVISYSIYMTHFIIYTVFGFMLPGDWTAATYMTLIGTTFVLSVCTYYVIERPARNAIRYFAKSHRPPLEKA